MVKLGVLAVWLSISAISIGFASGVKITERTRYYSVSGPTVQALVKTMTKRGPFSEDHGKRAVGLADYTYRTRIKTSKKNGFCRVTKV